MSTPPKKTRSTSKDSGFNNMPGLSTLASVMKEVGILGFILIMVTAIFLWYGSEEQKREFIDKFILFKDVNSQPFPFGIVVFALVSANIMQHIYYSKRLKLSEDECKRVAEERTELQQAVLGKKLKSSVPSKTNK